MISFQVPAVPVAQPRPRAVVGPTGRARVHGEASRSPVAAYKATVRLAATEASDGRLLRGPLAVRLTAVLPRPKRLCWKTRETPRMRHDRKPDLDNLIKSTLDALGGLLWGDDAQVATLEASKCYAAGGEPPHAEIEVEELEP